MMDGVPRGEGGHENEQLTPMRQGITGAQRHDEEDVVVGPEVGDVPKAELEIDGEFRGHAGGGSHGRTSVCHAIL
jgi:hypothetical protein